MPRRWHYSTEAETTQTFFATVQNKLHFAIHGRTASELIVERADSKKEKMGLTTWKNAPHGKILKPDVSVAKNYLTEKELKSLDRFVTMYLDYAEDQAGRNIPMTMQGSSPEFGIIIAVFSFLLERAFFMTPARPGFCGGRW